MSRRPDDGRWWGGPAGWDPQLRIGDAERNDVAEALSQHYSAGRLDETELKERLDRATSARTGADLAGLLADLPPLAVPAPAPAPAPSRHRGTAWLVAAVVLLVLSMPWYAMHWVWFPRPPWFLVAVVALVLWRRSRRRSRRTLPPA